MTLEKIAADICEKNALPYGYFSQKYGKRKHYLAGYGSGVFTTTYHKNITDVIVFSWQGTVDDEKASVMLEPFTDLIIQLTKELT